MDFTITIDPQVKYLHNESLKWHYIYFILIQKPTTAQTMIKEGPLEKI